MDVCFSQGLDIRFMTSRIARALAQTRFWNLRHSMRQVTFAFDSLSIEPRWRRGVQMLLDAGIRPRQIQSFFLVGFDSTFEEDMRRVEIIREYGADPFCMVYRDRESGKAIKDPRVRHFARWINRRLYKTHPFEEYSRWDRERRQGVLAL